MLPSLQILSPQHPLTVNLLPESIDPREQINVMRLAAGSTVSLSLLFLLPTSFHIFVASLIAYFVGTKVCCSLGQQDLQGPERMVSLQRAVEPSDRVSRVAPRRAA